MSKFFNKDSVRLIYCAALPGYIFSVIYVTLIDRISGIRRTQFTPFWEISNLISSARKLYWLSQIAGNIAMFIPLGIMLPVLYDRFKSAKATVLAGFVFSFLIELTQLITCRGTCELDDLIHNTLGTFIGFLFCPLILKLLTGKGL